MPKGVYPRRSVEDRLWSSLDKSAGPAGCWPFTGQRMRRGLPYGLIFDRRTRRAHRVAWELTHGPIPEGLNVLHRCDNPPCCNPAHLFLGTDGDNAADREAKGRSARNLPSTKRPADSGQEAVS